MSTLAYSQDSLWQKTSIDENLTISLPPGINQIDTSYIQNGKKIKFKMFVAQAEYSAIGVVVSNEFNANIDNKETLEKVLSEISKGAVKKMKEGGVECFSSDTLLSKIPCKKMKCRGEVKGIYMNILHYTMVVNDIAYTMQAAFVPEYTVGGHEEMDRLLKSVSIDPNSVKELQFESKAYSVGYKAGYILVGLMVLAVVVIGVIFLIRKLQ